VKRNIIILIVVFIFVVSSIYYLESMKAGSAKINSVEKEDLNEELKEGKYSKAPELVGVSGYLNTDGEQIKISDLEGKVVLVDFWTYTCINCIRTFPYLTEWDEKYREKGLVIIGVHTPEFEFEKEYDNVEAAIKKYDIKYPVVQDNDYATWGAYKNRFWPRKYLVDSEGYIRYDHIGEGSYEETELKIQELLAEIGEDVSDMETTEEGSNLRLVTTPELYAGYGFALSRGQNIGNPEGLIPGQTVLYKVPEEMKKDIIYLDGIWKNNIDNLELTGEEGSIVLDFQAKEVNIVADSESDIIMEVFIDGEYVNEEQAGSDVQFSDGKAFVTVNAAQLYNVVNGEYGEYKLELKVMGNGFSFNAFTFGG